MTVMVPHTLVWDTAKKRIVTLLYPPYIATRGKKRHHLRRSHTAGTVGARCNPGIRVGIN